jgi:nucleoid DNA-binding protein
LAPEVPKELIKRAVDSVFEEIEELISTMSSIEIDLHILGKIVLIEKSISYEPFIF